LSILALNNYMIFNERALFLPQIEAAKKGLMQFAKRRSDSFKVNTKINLYKSDLRLN